MREQPEGPPRYLFMGEMEDPVLDVFIARGAVKIYDVTLPATAEEIRALESLPRAPPVENPDAGLWVLNGTPSRWVKCGCNRCFMGPCPQPIERGA